MLIRSSLNNLLLRAERGFTAQNVIEVSRGAFNANVGLCRSLCGLQIIPVLKGNAYGHGIQQVAEALKGLDIPYIAVDGYFEALRVREVSKQPVLVMGAILPQNFANMKYSNFAFVVQDAETIKALGKTGKRVKVHLEVNTGFNRYGADEADVPRLAKLILSYKNLTLEGVMAHLADSDGEDPATVTEAVIAFDQAVEAVKQAGANPTIIHTAQTAGSQVVKSTYANAIRLGIGLYGINPFPPGHKLHSRLKDLRPALRLTSTITKITQLKKGDKVSYNYTYTAPKDMRIGVIPLGYYEGIPRALSNVGVVKIGNAYAPIVGRVNMNHTMVNLDGINAKVGDKVVVYSNNPKDKNSIGRIAADHGLFNYTLLTGLSPDIRRILVK